MSDRTKNMFFIIGEHLLFVVLSLFLVYTFTGLMNKHLMALSVITAILYVSSTYSAGWSASKKDYGIAKEKVRHIPDAVPEYNVFSGFLIALPNLVLSLVLMVLAFAKGQLWEVLYRLYNYSYIYIIIDKAGNLNIAFCLAVSAVTYLAYAIGYINGKDKRVFLIKYLPSIVYKRNRE